MSARPRKAGSVQRAPGKPKKASPRTVPRERDASGRFAARSQAAETPETLVRRVTRAIERELDEIERIVAGDKVPATRRTDAERRARTLASLARTLGEMTKLQTAQMAGRASDDDAVPRDLDDFRATLERRLAQLVED